MVEGCLDATEVARIVAATIDLMTTRLVEFAMRLIGPPPVPWAWLALGSSARREQSFLTDQDHAIASDPIGEPLGRLDRYFLGLAQSISAGLEAAGIPRCRADVVAQNRSLRRPVGHWAAAFTGWMDEPRLDARRQASILFDLRRVTGPLVVERALDPVIGLAPRPPLFLRQMAIQAIDTQPPARRLRG